MIYRVLITGSIDEAMIPLVEYLNSKDETFTTSCCSGRVSIGEALTFVPDKTNDANINKLFGNLLLGRMSANFNEPLEVIQSGFTDTVKEGCPWVFMSHTLIDDVDNVIDTVSKAINENEENQVIIIKFEGAIAHFIVRTLALGKLGRFFRRISS